MLQTIELCPLSARIARLSQPADPAPEPTPTPPTVAEIDAAARDVRRTIEEIDRLVLGAYLGRLRALATTLKEELAEVGGSVDPGAFYSPAGQPWHGHFGLLLLEDEVRDAYMLAREADLLARVCRERLARPVLERFRQEGDLPTDLAAESEAVDAEFEYWDAHPSEIAIPPECATLAG